MSRVLFDPRLSKRLQATYKLGRPPTTLAEFVELGKALLQVTPELQEYVDRTTAPSGVSGSVALCITAL